MYQELVRRNVIIIALSLVVFLLFALYTTNYINQKNVTSELVYLSKILADEIDQTVSETEVREIVNRFSKDQTWLSIYISNSYGDIMIDSTSDGMGEGVYSSFTAQELELVSRMDPSDRTYIIDGKIYYIEQLNDDIIMRTSIQIVDNTNYIFQGVFLLGIVLIVVLFISIKYTGKTIGGVKEAFENVTNSMRTISKGQYNEITQKSPYQEVQSAYREVNAVNNSVFQYIQRISAERDKINFIINNIMEGIVIVGVSGKIYSANKYAVAAIGMKTDADTISDAMDDEMFLSNIFKVAEGGEKELRFDFYNNQTDKIYLVGISRFNHEHIGEDLISIVLTDVTDSRREEQIKIDFVANVSHELKTPITSISGFSELLLSGLVQNPDDFNQYIKNIYKESCNMKNTIDELLYLSKLDYNKNKVTFDESVDLLALSNRVLDNAQRRADKHNVRLLDVQGNCVVKGSESLLEHMLSNLVSNAIKYNKEGGTVAISLGYKDGVPFLSVTDSGMGIDSRHIDKLFDRFYRVDNSRCRQTGGTGLGLTIVQKIVRLHNASISIDSVVGKGSTFTITFGGKHA
ncbi:MAG TPA: hypothetical protein IAD47_02090 [Candidatus Limihabitans stercoravium]|nr:hypothetical protein [Candidatus Limihabitans stercoravium]